MASAPAPRGPHRRAGLPTEKSTASFWHSEPSPFLLGHRTTAALPSAANVVVVGSGITGASAARFFAEDGRAAGLGVVMLEAREACWGATGRNGGHCQPLLFDSTPDVAAFELRNWKAVESYIKEHNVPCEWREVAGCRTFWSAPLMKAAIDDVARLKKNAPELGEMVTVVTDEAELKKHRVKGAAGATLTAKAASMWPYKYVAFILERLIKEGRLNLQTKTPVTSMEPCPDEWKGAAVGARYSVHTSRGIINARHVILATNGYTSHLLPSFADLIVPVRGEMSALLPPPGSERLGHSYGFVGAHGQDPNHDDYLVQRPFSGVLNPAGHLMYGGGRGEGRLETIGMTDDSVIDEGSAAYLRRTLLGALDLAGEAESMKELTATHQWTGIMGYSRDNHPWVGPVPGQPGVWLVGGYTGHGMPNGTLCGKAVVDMLLAAEQGVSTLETQRRLVAEGDLPRAYLITEDRIARARALPSVREQDEIGMVGNHSREFLKRARQEAKL